MNFIGWSIIDIGEGYCDLQKAEKNGVFLGGVTQG